MHQQLIVLVLVVAAVSAASVDRDAEEQHSSIDRDRDAEELRDLLVKVKTYLDKSEQKVETRGNAHTDVLTAFTNPDVAHDPVDGYWTGFLNVDWMWSYGTGEYEDCSRVFWQQNNDADCKLGCEQPIQSVVRVLAENTIATWADIEGCIGPISRYQTGCGFACANYQARDYPKTNCNLAKCESFGLGVNCTRCPDIEANFFCAGTQPPTDQCCPYSDGCTTLVGKRDLRSRLEAVRDLDERRDIAAYILDDVKEALRIDDV